MSAILVRSRQGLDAVLADGARVLAALQDRDASSA